MGDSSVLKDMKQAVASLPADILLNLAFLSRKRRWCSRTETTGRSLRWKHDIT